jgi:hypothetical protein
MIYIKHNTTNQVCLTLTESTTLLNPYFLFEFENTQTNAKQYYSGSDLSTYKSRFNLFEITEDSEGELNAINAPIKLVSGQYIYRVYQTATQSIDTNDIVGDVLEEGIMIVSGTNELSIYD